MPAMPPPVADERQALREYLPFSTSTPSSRVAFGLTDEQARATPSVSALSIGGLIKHVTGVPEGWMRHASRPHRHARRPTSGPMEERSGGVRRTSS